MRRVENRGRRGMVQIWVGLLLFLFVGVIGLAADTGRLVYVDQQLESAAEAAALAAVSQVRTSRDDARAFAYSTALANTVNGANLILTPNPTNDPNGDVVIGRYVRMLHQFIPTSEDSETTPNAVMIRARRTIGSDNGDVPLIFGPLFGADSASLTCETIAMVGGGTGAGLIVLDHTAPSAMYVHGGAILNVDGGGIHVNSNATLIGTGNAGSNAVYVTGDATVITPLLYRVGGISGENQVTGTVEQTTDVLDDPFAYLPVPPLGTLRTGPTNPDAEGTQLDPFIYDPGYYPAGIVVGNQTHVRLRAGVYVVEDYNGGNGAASGDAIRIRGGGVLHGSGVMVYLKHGSVNINAGGNLSLAPPTTGIYEHVTFFQARDNTETAQFGGTEDSGGEVIYENLLAMELAGAYYFPNNHTIIRGTPGGGGQSSRMTFNQMVTNTLECTGNVEVTVRYIGQETGAGNRVFIVE